MNAPITTATPEKKPLPAGALRVESMDLDAQGIAHREDGKVVFIDGALPFEVVRAQVNRKKNTWENATLTEVLTPSTLRVTPPCPHFGLHQGACGGCKMQHLEAGAQVAIKQRVLEDNLWHLGKVKAQTILRPIQGPALGYRYRARLSVRYVNKKNEVLIGFHERKSRYIADMQSCAVLPPAISALLLPLRELIASMQTRDHLPQIELACGDTLTALVLRHLQPLEDGDKQKLRDFAAAHPSVNIQWWLQPKGPDTVQLLDADDTRQLSYALDEFGVIMPFKPTDFTQVNPHINRVLVGRALRLLGVQAHERVIDWFCGLGNFTLPLATLSQQVLGIEGAETLVARARSNAQQYLQGILATNAVKPAWTAPDFEARNLFEMTAQMLIADGRADKWLVDPPREGAFALVQALAAIHQSRIAAEDTDPSVAALADAQGWQPPQRIVYVSCNPATLARDAEVLVHQAGYTCTHAGMVNMFPHTAHVESMAVFEKN
ncbi:MAG: 23S rRNA (uracil(1939)-C(5))-methyltransferase RlmD [Brachymonas sp.]